MLIFYISYYPINKYFADSSLDFYMVAIFNAASTFGRIAPNALSDLIGVFNTFVPMAFILSITVFCMFCSGKYGGHGGGGSGDRLFQRSHRCITSSVLRHAHGEQIFDRYTSTTKAHIPLLVNG